MLGAGGAASGQNGERRTLHAGEGALRDASKMLRKDAMISEFGVVIRPANLQNPAVSFLQSARRSNLGGRNHKKRAKARIERPDLFRANVKLNGRWSGTARPIFPAIYDDERAEFARFVVRSRTRFGRGQKDCGKKHGKTGNGGEPAVPKAERQDDERRAGKGQNNAEGHPGLSIAADAEEFGNQEYKSKQSADQRVA